MRTYLAFLALLLALAQPLTPALAQSAGIRDV